MTSSLVIDILILVLLAVSVGYCVVLNRRLSTLRQGQKEFVTLIARFDKATQRAELNIERLRGVSAEIDEHLGERISSGRALRDELRFLIERAAPAIERSMSATASRGGTATSASRGGTATSASRGGTVTTASRGETRAATGRAAPLAPFSMTPPNETSGSVVEADLLEALREARKG